MPPAHPTPARLTVPAPHHGTIQRHRTRSFTLVLAGGGARGLAHAGVLAGLARQGLHPTALVGVSMGAIVATAYALNPRWLEDLRSIDMPGLPGAILTGSGTVDSGSPIRAILEFQRLLGPILIGRGIGARARNRVMGVLEQLTLGEPLEACQPPVTVVATDLRSGERVALRHGPAARAAYASAALAGVLPPLEHDGYLLADGGYADLAPIDLARTDDESAVIAVDTHQDSAVRDPRTGLDAALRAMDICHHQHAALRLRKADLVLRPRFPATIGTLDFRHADAAFAAGERIVEEDRSALHDLLREHRRGPIESSPTWGRSAHRPASPGRSTRCCAM